MSPRGWYSGMSPSNRCDICIMSLNNELPVSSSSHVLILTLTVLTLFLLACYNAQCRFFRMLESYLHLFDIIHAYIYCDSSTCRLSTVRLRTVVHSNRGPPPLPISDYWWVSIFVSLLWFNMSLLNNCNAQGKLSFWINIRKYFLDACIC